MVEKKRWVRVLVLIRSGVVVTADCSGRLGRMRWNLMLHRRNEGARMDGLYVSEDKARGKGVLSLSGKIVIEVRTMEMKRLLSTAD